MGLGHKKKRDFSLSLMTKYKLRRCHSETKSKNLMFSTYYEILRFRSG